MIKRDKQMLNAMNMMSTVASVIIAPVIVCAFIGWWLDKWLGTFPLICIGGVVLGMVAGLWSAYKRALEVKDK